MWEPAHARRFAIDHLRASADAHDRGDLDAIEDGYEAFDNGVPREGPAAEDLLIALELWSAWIDSKNHDWLFYEPLTESSWAPLARRVASALEAEQPMPEEALLYFKPDDRAGHRPGCLGFLFGA